MVLTDTAAPGYETSNSADPMIYAEENARMGYVPAYRATFLKSSSYDPIDLAPRFYADGVDIKHPLLGATTPNYNPQGLPVADEQGIAGGKWNRKRFTLATDLLLAMYDALDASKKLQKPLLDTPKQVPQPARNTPLPLQGDFALYLRPPGDLFGNCILWDKRDSILKEQPARKADSNYLQSAFDALRAASSRCLFCYTYLNPDLYQVVDQPAPPKNLSERTEQFAVSFNQRLAGTKANWDGYIIDLTQEKLEEALPLLAAVRAEPTPRSAVRAQQPRR
jgi:hypothetical protein